MQLFLDIMIEISFWAGISVFLYLGYIEIFCNGMPHFKTAPIVCDKIIDLIQEDIQDKGFETYAVYELGSGFGGNARRIAKALPDVKIVSIEIDRIAYAYATIMAKIKRLDNLTFLRGNIFKLDLSDADAVVFYLSNGIMDRLGVKLRDELPSKALIISNSFYLGDGWDAEHFIPVDTKYPEQLGLRLYRQG